MRALTCSDINKALGRGASSLMGEVSQPCDIMGQEIHIGDIVMFGSQVFENQIGFVEDIDLDYHSISPDGLRGFTSSECLKLNDINEKTLALWVLADFKKIGV